MRFIASILLAALVPLSGAALTAQADQPVAAARWPQAAQTAARPQAESGTKGSSKNKANPGFLIIGTVFDEKALSFPGVQVRVRRVDEKKFRWETHTNSRGEFAVRVPEGFDYEVVVRAKHYQDQAKSVTTNNGDIQLRLSIKLEPASPAAKAGAKS
jgi:hypothetical protein